MNAPQRDIERVAFTCLFFRIAEKYLLF